MNVQKSGGSLYRVAMGIVIFLALIGIAAVLRRTLTLTGIIKTRVNPRFGQFDIGLTLNPVLTFVHIMAGGLFMILAPLQFVPKIRMNHLWFHRLSGRILFISGLIIGISALIMSFKTTIGGATETSATLFFAILFLFSLFKGLYHIRRREVALHREWMLRMFAIGLAVATVRPIVGMFFAFSKLSPHEFFGIAFWIGFTAHLVVAEAWINYTRNSQNQNATFVK
ncbi:MAG: DUF2306 domain-containing protein [Bacteroidetes bacterium]|nr:DUF2306 domain-containing protein [Bacteroidota bacterium]